MLERLPPVQRHEWWFVWAVILTAVVASSIPYAIGWMHDAQSSDAFLFLSSVSPSDSNVYYSYIEQVRQGGFLVGNDYTTIPQSDRLFHPLWLLLGWIGRLTGIATPLLHQCARILSIGVFLILAYRFLTAFFPTVGWRRVGIVLLAFSSGVGVMVAFLRGRSLDFPPLADSSIDLWITEGNTFMSFMHTPLFPLSQIAMLAVLILFLSSQGFSKRFWWASVLLFLLAVGHTYDAVILGAVLGGFFLTSILADFFRSPHQARSYLLRLITVFLFPLVGIGYLVWVLVTEPAIAGWIEQNITRSPHVVYYLFGYGLLLPFAAVGSAWAWRARHRFGLLCMTWGVVALLLVFVPAPIQRRFIAGAHIPITILATIGLRESFSYLRRHVRSWKLVAVLAIPILVLGLFSTNSVMVYQLSRYVVYGDDTNYPRYTSDDFVDAAVWLEAHTSRANGILSGAWNGVLLPGLTGRKVVIGHGHQTPDYEALRERLGAFGQSRLTREEELQFLRETRTTHLVLARGDAWFERFDPTARSYLTTIYANESVTIYRVIGEN